MPSQIYYYILRWDDGYAPCVNNGVLTLAICKPSIRRKAGEGDWIIGISPKKDGHELCYMAQVTRKIPGYEYYTQNIFSKRGDRIYSFDGKKFSLRRRRKVHEEADKKTDVGKFPTYQNAVVLKSSRGSFWYFGDKAWSISPERYPALTEKLDHLQQGHRCNHTARAHKELRSIIARMKRMKPGIHGKPRNPPSRSSHDSKCSKHHGVC